MPCCRSSCTNSATERVEWPMLKMVPGAITGKIWSANCAFFYTSNFALRDNKSVARKAGNVGTWMVKILGLYHHFTINRISPALGSLTVAMLLTCHGKAGCAAIARPSSFTLRNLRAQNLCHRSPAASNARHRRSLLVQGIGFELPGAPETAKSVEKTAEDLTRLAASLLLYQQSLAGKPAQAFLNLLLHLQKGSPLKLLEHYGELYKALAAEGRSSWQDYLLDQIIRGADSPFARAAAKGQPTAHLLRAVEHDLDVLQQLSVTEKTMADWVKGTVYGVTDAWLEAASSLASPQGSAAAAVPLDATWTVGEPGAPAPAWLLAPLSEAQRAALATEISEKWRWGQAATLLERYHAAHGHGLVSMHSVLSWTGQSLQAQDVLKGTGSLQAADLGLPPGSAVLAALERVVSELHSPAPTPASPREPPHHWCLTADPLTRWQLLCALLGLLEAAAAEGRGPAFRAVVVPAGQLSSMAELAWALAQHPRARFLVVLQSGDNLPPQALADLAAMLSGMGGFSWPSNATVIAGFSGELPDTLQPVLRNALKWGTAAIAE